MEYGLIGERLSHSYSREVHKRLADYSYELKELDRCEFASFMTERSFKAINVTIPYKEAVIPYLYYVDPVAREVGAVNTIVNREGKLYGYNTDVYGMAAMITNAKITLEGKKVVILGTGGTSKTAHAVAGQLGAKEIITVSRKAAEGVITYSELYLWHTDAEVIINTTPVGMYPSSEPTPVELSKFPALLGVVDVIYNPLRTSLVLDATELNIPYATGLYMLVMQAVRAVEIFLDTEIDGDKAESVYRDILLEKENTVLIGMPSSGKTTVGRALAQELGGKFIDTDDLVRELSGMTIPDIFEKNGEKAFRDIESDAIVRAAAESGAVIATGGGAVLRRENVRALKKTGRLFFIDRPLEKLMPTADRPLASDGEALKKRYNERHPLYLRISDERIDGGGTVCEVLDLILEKKK